MRGLIQLQMVENGHAQSRVSQRMDWIKHALYTAWHNIADRVAADGRNTSRLKPGANCCVNPSWRLQCVVIGIVFGNLLASYMEEQDIT